MSSWLLWAILLVAVSGAPLSGGPAGFGIRGVILDPSGAVVPGAAVMLKRGDGASLSSTTADPKGAFAFDGMAAGRYELEVRYEGFKVYTARIVVDARPRPSLKVVLEIAGVAEEVTVGRDGLSVGWQDNRDAVTVDQRSLQGLPVFDQDY